MKNKQGIQVELCPPKVENIWNNLSLRELDIFIEGKEELKDTTTNQGTGSG